MAADRYIVTIDLRHVTADSQAAEVLREAADILEQHTIGKNQKLYVKSRLGQRIGSITRK